MKNHDVNCLAGKEDAPAKLLPFLDDLTEMRYKIRSVTVPPHLHEEFKEFWRRAVNCFSNPDYGSYNMATIILSEKAKCITVEFWPDLETYDSVLKRCTCVRPETTIEACGRFREAVFELGRCFMESLPNWLRKAMCYT